MQGASDGHHVSQLHDRSIITVIFKKAKAVTEMTLILSPDVQKAIAFPTAAAGTATCASAAEVQPCHRMQVGHKRSKKKTTRKIHSVILGKKYFFAKAHH